MQCPYCHKKLKIHIGKPHSALGAGWDYSRGHQFESSPFNIVGAADLSGPVEATRAQPARPATVESDVFVPLLQSLATGVAVAIPVTGLTIWLRWEWYAPLVAAGVTVTIAWLQLLGAHRKLLWVVETVSDLVEGDPASAPASVTMEVKHEEAGRIGRMQFVDLPVGVTQDQLIDWASSVVAGVKTPARANWVGSGKPFSRDIYDLFTKAMIEAGILATIPGKGNQLTVGGRHALKSLINSS
jgi:hypothetical protein